jgi:hypothetical protein
MKTDYLQEIYDENGLAGMKEAILAAAEANEPGPLSEAILAPITGQSKEDIIAESGLPVEKFDPAKIIA